MGEKVSTVYTTEEEQKTARGEPVSIVLVEPTEKEQDRIVALLSQSSLNASILRANSMETAKEMVEENLDAVHCALVSEEASLSGAKECAALGVPAIVLTETNEKDTSDLVALYGASDCLDREEATPYLLERTVKHAIQRSYAVLALQRANHRLNELIRKDPITGLLNRRGLEEVLSTEAIRCASSTLPMQAILLDIDDFRNITETFGEAASDVVVAETARVLKEVLRPSDHLARVGGDKFLALIIDARFAEGTEIAERLRLSIKKTSILLDREKEISITASVGHASVPPECHTVDKVLAKTLDPLTKSKILGKNRVVTASGPARRGKRDQFQDQLQLMRQGKGLRVVKLPLINIETEAVVGYELLSRAEGPFSNPADFFALALEEQALNLVDEQCLLRCLKEARDRDDGLIYHVNLYPSTIMSFPVPKFVSLLSDQSVKTCLEISEQQIIGDPVYLAGHVHALKEAGVHVALDDVGFGRSSLESLIVLEPDTIKIDRRWVTGIRKHERRRRSLSRLIRVARALDIGVVAEGIETREDLEEVRKMGILLGQGFLWGRPS